MSILQAENSQFTLADDGGVFYQKQVSNPLPGEQIALLEKGKGPLKPGVVLIDAPILEGLDKVQLRERMETWLDAHLKTVLEPLVLLEDDVELSAPCKGIAYQVHEAMGIVPRESLESLIADLDTDMRKELRGKRIRLGPILAFIPALNKPAAVRLRALLWGLYHDKELPMDVPKDGIVSFAVDSSTVDKGFYQAIGYPVFGQRAIRIDMLDRVISAVYDAAENGKFKAEHKMAEWLGSSIEGLYDVLSAMGHAKIYDPADEAEKTESVSDDADKSETAPEAVMPVDSKAEKPDVKPELATFRLKKGKAFQQKSGSGKKFSGDKVKKKHNSKFKGKKKQDHGPRVISTGPKKKQEDSPFAILQQLKTSSNE